METRKITDTPVQEQVTENTKILVEQGGKVGRIPAGEVGVQDAVRHDAVQDLTDEQKARARTNIGAADAEAIGTTIGKIEEDVTRLKDRACVLHTKQELDDEQKTQARANIGAISYAGAIPLEVTYEMGGISGSDGANNNLLMTNRFRSDFVLATDFKGVACSNADYQLYLYGYDKNKTLLCRTAGWLSSCNLEEIPGYTRNVAYVRITVRKSNDNAFDLDTAVADSGVVVYAPIIRETLNKMREHTKMLGIDYDAYGLPILELTGNTVAMTKENPVVLSYRYGTKTGTCTCKWQGLSSVREGYPKRNYTIVFDTPLTVKDEWGAQSKYCLKANWIDPSAARNVVSARLWSQVVASRPNVHEKLKAAPNYGAVDGFPCLVVVNGEFNGLYTWNIPKGDWMFAMGEGEAEYVVLAESNSKMACQLRELAICDETDFDIDYKPDGVEDSTVVSSFNTLIQAAISSGEDWETSLAPYLDIDSVFDYFIFVNCIGGYDNICKNVMYGTYDGVKWFLTAYDMDTTYGSNPYGSAWYRVISGRNEFASTGNWNKLAWLMYGHSKDRLKTRYKELRAGVLSDENVWYMFTNFINGIPRGLYNLDSTRWPTMPATATANLANYMEFYRMHCAYLDKEIEAM